MERNDVRDLNGSVSYEAVLSVSILTFLKRPVCFCRAAPRPLPLWNISSCAEMMRKTCSVGDDLYVCLKIATRPRRSLFLSKAPPTYGYRLLSGRYL